MTTTAEDSRAPLLAAVDELRTRAATPAVRIALAEAEFRLAIAPDAEPAESIERLRAAVEQDPFCPKLFLHLGRFLHQSGRPAAALSEYRHAIRLASASPRAHLLLALALLDMGPATRDLADLVLGAVNSGRRADLSAAVAEVDTWLEEQATPDAGGERKARRTAPAKPGGLGAPNAWRVALFENLTRAKAPAGRQSALLAAGLARAADRGEIGEYATACVLLLAGDQQAASVRHAAGSVLAEHAGHPAVLLLDAALRLAEAGDPADFVELATGYLERGVLPPELVCWSHLAKYGPQKPGTALDALALLERYPRSIRDSDPFGELTLAVLDGHARKAWAEERFAEARLLWQEAGSIDRFRVPVALNLALLAAKTRSAEDYEPAWQRLCELHYLQAAGAGDVQLLLEERRTLHLALAQQAQLRHCATSGPRDAQTPEEIEAWLADADALTEWLCQWDLYYINARLGFRSPAHLLGVAADAAADVCALAGDAFVRHVQLALHERNWAGTAVFVTMAATVAQTARLELANAETRDGYYLPERAAAQALAEVALSRCLTLRRMMRALLEHPSAEHLRLGYDLARRQLALPWQVLRPICVERGLIAHDVDPVELFQQDLVSLATHWEEPKPQSPDEHARRLSVLDGCVELVPREPLLRLLRCLALRGTGDDDKACAAALEAVRLQSPDDDESRRRVTAQLIDLIDLIGWEALPKSVREPGGPAPTRELVLDSVRRALERFPHSFPLRRELARLLVATGRAVETDEAITLLGAGVESALSAEQRTKYAEQLTAIKSVAATVSLRESIRQLVEPAQEAARAAIETYVRDTGDETRKAALAAVHAAVGQVAEGRRMAEQARLGGELASLDEVLGRLRQMAAELGGGDANDAEG